MRPRPRAGMAGPERPRRRVGMGGGILGWWWWWDGGLFFGGAARDEDDGDGGLNTREYLRLFSRNWDSVHEDHSWTPMAIVQFPSVRAVVAGRLASETGIRGAQMMHGLAEK